MPKPILTVSVPVEMISRSEPNARAIDRRDRRIVVHRESDFPTTGGGERADMGAGQPYLAIFDHYVAFLQLQVALAHAFDFPALEHHADLDLVLDEIIVSRDAVGGDGAG